MPQRDRIGFDDTYISEEGRPYYGSIDDYDMFLPIKASWDNNFFMEFQIMIILGEHGICLRNVM